VDYFVNSKLRQLFPRNDERQNNSILLLALFNCFSKIHVNYYFTIMVDQLIELWLNSRQAQCWLYIRQYGVCAASTVASSCNLERTNCYKILCSLEELGLLSRTSKHWSTHFYIPDKSVLDTLILKQEQALLYQKSQLWTIKSQLDALIDPQTHDTPPIQIRSGRSGFQQW
jgi:predicted transcriptional regulator